MSSMRLALFIKAPQGSHGGGGQPATISMRTDPPSEWRLVSNRTPGRKVDWPHRVNRLDAAKPPVDLSRGWAQEG
jgi:hypothetical protein